MDTKFWVGFNHVKGIGAVRLRMLLDYFGDLEAAWQSSSDEIRNAGLPSKVIENFLLIRKKIDLDEILAYLTNQGIQVVTWEDDQYPSLLKEIGQPPPVLYVQGSLKTEDNLAVSIVGTRRMSYYGRQVAEELAEKMASLGVTVVSGLARGIDAVAHDACLKASGRTLAVLGCGVDRIYPPEHRRLAVRIQEQGALISDYAPGTPPDSVNFPPRNRIISGLSLATVIVEAGERSGALITANFAVEQGREVFAVPGSIYQDQCKGANRLINQGAHPLINLDDLIEVLQPFQKTGAQISVKAPLLDDIEVSFLQILRGEPKHVDEICAITALPVEKVSSTLVMMEIKGYIKHVGSMNYIAIDQVFN